MGEYSIAQHCWSGFALLYSTALLTVQILAEYPRDKPHPKGASSSVSYIVSPRRDRFGRGKEEVGRGTVSTR